MCDICFKYSSISLMCVQKHEDPYQYTSTCMNQIYSIFTQVVNIFQGYIYISTDLILNSKWAANELNFLFFIIV